MKFTLNDARKFINLLGIKSSDYGFTDYDLKNGLNIELEHSDITNGNLILTGKIAMAHLLENPRYYKLLKKLHL